MADADITSGTPAEAKAWIDALASGVRGSWRLEIAERRARFVPRTDGGAPLYELAEGKVSELSDDLAAYTKLTANAKTDADGKHVRAMEQKELPFRVRRFAKGVPLSLVAPAVRYLVSLAPYSGILWNGEEVQGRYRPTRTFWRRDDQENVGARAPGTYTLVQDLVELDASAEAVGVTVSETCLESVDTEWRWDEADVEASAAGSVPGVMVSVQSVSRNEDGTFDYAVVTRTSKAWTSPESVVACDAEKTVKRREWRNIFRSSDGTPDYRDLPAGHPEIPSPCDDKASGRTVEVEWRLNDDCTWDAVATVTERNAQNPRSEEATDDKFRRVETRVETKTQSDPPAYVDEASGLVSPQPAGTVSTVKREVDQTGMVTESVSTQVEHAVPAARKSVRKTARGLETTTLDRSQPAATSRDLPAGAKVGDRLQTTFTEGGLLDVETTTLDTSLPGVLEVSSEQDVFEGKATKTEPVDSAAAAAELGLDPSKPLDPGEEIVQETVPEQGHLKTVSLRLDENSGTYDRREEHAESREVANARERLSITPDGAIREKTARNVRDPSLMPSAVGQTVQKELKPDGTYDVTNVEPAKATNLTVEAESRVTAFNVTHADAKNRQGPSALLEQADHVVGRITSRRSQQTAGGAWTDQQTEDVANPNVTSAVEVKRTLTAVVRTERVRNVDGALAAEPGTAASLGIGESVSSVKNDYGLYDQEKVTTERDSAADGMIMQDVTEQTPVSWTRTVRVSHDPTELHDGDSEVSGMSRFLEMPDETQEDQGTQTATQELVSRRLVRTRQDDGSYVSELAEEHHRVNVTADTEYRLPYSLVLVRSMSWCTADFWDEQAAGFRDTVQEWAAMVRATKRVGSKDVHVLGSMPTSLAVQFSRNPDERGLWSGTMTATLSWPEGSMGSIDISKGSGGNYLKLNGSTGKIEDQWFDENDTYFAVDVAGTYMAAGRGMDALSEFVNGAQSSNAVIADAVQHLFGLIISAAAATVQSSIDSITDNSAEARAAKAQLSNYKAFILGLADNVEMMIVKDVNASLVPETGQWTSSYRVMSSVEFAKTIDSTMDDLNTSINLYVKYAFGA